MWHCWQISKHAFHVSYMFNCSATPTTFDANNRVTRKCKPWPDLLPTSETRSELCKSFYFCSLRMLTTGRSERRSRSWLWSCTRTRTTPRLNFCWFRFQFFENAGISWILVVSGRAWKVSENKPSLRGAQRWGSQKEVSRTQAKKTIFGLLLAKMYFAARYDMYGDDEESGGKSKQGRNYQSWQ